MRRAAALALLVALAGPRAAAQEPSRTGSIRAEATVEKVLVDAYVIGPHGGALLGLGPQDFVLKVGGVEVPVGDVEFLDALGRAHRAKAPAEAREPGTPEFPEGRLIVLFCQADFGRYRTKGLMRMTNELGVFLDRFLPTDRVAVLSYDSHLKLRLDFTNDRVAIRKALYESLKIGGAPEPAPSSPFPSIGEHFDLAAARDASSIEKGLYVTAKALEKIPGGKVMFFLGWGLYVNRQPREGLWYARAVNALQQARVNVFSMDVTDADWHTLEGTLEHVAEMTGGTYAKVHVFSAQALDLAFRAIEGRYVVVFDRPEGPRGRHALELALRSKKGQVLARPFFDDP